MRNVVVSVVTLRNVVVSVVTLRNVVVSVVTLWLPERNVVVKASETLRLRRAKRCGYRSETLWLMRAKRCGCRSETTGSAGNVVTHPPDLGRSPPRNALEWIGLRQSPVDPPPRCHYHLILPYCTIPYTLTTYTQEQNGKRVSLPPLVPATRMALGRGGGFQ